MYYLCSEDKGTDKLHVTTQLRLCFRMYAKNMFSHDKANFCFSFGYMYKPHHAPPPTPGSFRFDFLIAKPVQHTMYTCHHGQV